MSNTTAVIVTAGQRIVRYGYAPFMLVGINGAGIALATAGVSETWLLALLAIAIASAYIAEHLIPYDNTWNTDHRDTCRDRIHAAVNETMILASVAVLPLFPAVAPELGIWPRHWPFVVQVVVAVLGADFGITTVHLASHKINTLWRFHAVHHSVTRFYGLNGLMKHPLHQAVQMTAGVAPLVLIGLPAPVAGALALAVCGPISLTVFAALSVSTSQRPASGH